MDFSNMQNTPKKNQAFVSGAFIMGILSLISAFTCLNFFTPIFGGLGILFALLSKGKEEVMEKKAKNGLILSAVSLVATVALTMATFIFTFATMAQYEPDELHDYINEVYEETYGQSFDELYEEIYGEDFGEIYDETLKDLYGDM